MLGGEMLSGQSISVMEIFYDLKCNIMGWKSTIRISREEALELVFKFISKVHTLSDSELEDFLERLGYGEDSNLPYFGYNFNIVHDTKNDSDAL